MSPHEATARAKADPVLFLWDVDQHLIDPDPMFDYRGPRMVIHRAMQRVVYAELASGGIEVVR